MFDPPSLLYKIAFGSLNISFKHMCMQAVCVPFLLPSLPAFGHESSRELPLFSLCLTPMLLCIIICILASLEEILSLLSTLLLLVNDILASICKPCSFHTHELAHLLILLSVCRPFFCPREDCNTMPHSCLPVSMVCHAVFP